MDTHQLIPNPDAIPAPTWLLGILEQLTFGIHIILVNIVLGSILIILYQRIKKPTLLKDSLIEPSVKLIPSLMAITVTFGVAPLLFLQVTYGNLFYTSSVLMAVYWILIIPFLIIAYYGLYIHSIKFDYALFSKLVLAISAILILYIGFMLVNNNSLMEQPDKWGAYFNNKNGTILNTGYGAFWPRYFHFIVASISVGGLFLAVFWHFKKTENMIFRIKTGLRIFAYGTIVQILVGFWYLLSLPSTYIKAFMFGNILYSIILFLGILVAISAVVLALKQKVMYVLFHFLLLISLMVINRLNLRSLYLNNQFDIETLNLNPQYGVLALFLIIFIIGLATVGYMLKISFTNNTGRTA